MGRHIIPQSVQQLSCRARPELPARAQAEPKLKPKLPKLSPSHASALACKLPHRVCVGVQPLGQCIECLHIGASKVTSKSQPRLTCEKALPSSLLGLSRCAQRPGTHNSRPWCAGRLSAHIAGGAGCTNQPSCQCALSPTPLQHPQARLRSTSGLFLLLADLADFERGASLLLQEVRGGSSLTEGGGWMTRKDSPNPHSDIAMTPPPLPSIAERELGGRGRTGGLALALRHPPHQ